MAKTKPNLNVFDMTGGAKDFIDKAAPETTEAPISQDSTKTEVKQTATARKAPSTKQATSKAKPKKRDDSVRERIKQGKVKVVNIALDNEVHTRLKMEQLLRADEKLTMADIVTEALEYYWDNKD